MNRRIAYLTSVYARAGDTFIRREVEELRRRGWDVQTFSIRRADESESVSEDILREQRSTHYVLERGFWALLGAFLRVLLRAPRRSIEAIRLGAEIRPRGARGWLWQWIYLLESAYLAEQLQAREVALLHNHIAMNSGSVAMLASTLSGIPFSMTVHGPHEFMAADQWALGHKVAASAMTACISSFGMSQCMLFTPSEAWSKLTVVRCGLDAQFLAEPSPPSPGSYRFVSIGRLSSEKGQVLLVQAAARLRRQGLPVEIVLVGDGPSRGDIERCARELGVQAAVSLVGWRSSSEVRRSILDSRAVVLPSFAEGIPVVLMEAMALRRPVIATYVGGIPELVRPNENGWLVPAGSVDDLADAMRQALAATPTELLEMGERGRRLVLERHDLGVEVEKLSRLFERLCVPVDSKREPG